MLKKKGYIGAIGDDLPSLIPIFLGLTIFFSVFLTTYNVYRNTTDLYSIKNDAISIAGTIKEDPLFTDYNSFIKICGKINTKYNWNTFVIPLDLNTEQYSGFQVSDIHEDVFLKQWEDPENGFFCGNQTIDELKDALIKKDVIIYRYPVTVQQKFFVAPAWLFVAIWR